MLNYLWAFMLLIGIVFGALNGKLPEITTAALDSAKEAVSLSITMLGAMAFWMGLMEIATSSGVLERFCKKIDPFILFMFPGLVDNKEIRQSISTNFVADFLGLGWASTPAGLKAMEGLKRKSNSIVATKEMCTFLVLNISSIQLLSITMITYRTQYGSVNPTAIVGPSIAATGVSFLVAIILCKIMCRRDERRHIE